MKAKGETRVWTVEIVLEETPEETEAKALLELGEERLGGWGRARRNPTDPDLPKIGEELAAARALSDLAHKLLEQAAGEIEQFEGSEVRIHE